MRKNFPYDTEDLWNKDRRHVVHAWEPLDTGRTEGSMIIAEAEGIYIYDSDGNKFIDGPGGMWCVQIGYGRDEMAEAVADQIRAMPYYSPFTYFGTAPASNLAAKIAEMAPGDLNNVFMSTSGSEANDSAIRFVQFFNNMKGRPEKKHVITRQDAYHGSTYLSASLCGKERDKNHMDMITDWVHHISSPSPYRRPDGMSVDDFRDSKIKELEDKVLEVGADKVAAFIAEPVMASGGMMVPPAGYHKMCLDVCHKYDVIYISDEVVTGFGRLGHFFASEPVFDIVPDILTCAKGLTSGYLPLAATIISDRLYDQVEGKNSEGQSFSNGYTYTAHPVSCAAALKNIEIMEREKICEHVQEVGPYFHKKLEELRDISIVGDVRGKMLMGCVEAVMNKDTKEAFPYEAQIGKRIDVHAQERGLILRPFGSMCVFSPPLIITMEQIDTMVGIMRDAIEATVADLKSEGVWNG